MAPYEEGVWDAEIRRAERRRRKGTPIRFVLVPILVLMVVIAVLAYYFLLGHNGLGGGGALSYSIELSTAATGHAGGAYFVNLTYRASTGLTTGMTRWSIDTPGGTAVGNASAPGSCADGSTFAACIGQVAPGSGWFVLLLTLQGDILTSYPVASGGSTWTDGLVNFATGGSLAVVSGSALGGSQDTLHVAPGGSAAVSGSYTF